MTEAIAAWKTCCLLHAGREGHPMHLAGEARASRALWPAIRPARQNGRSLHHHLQRVAPPVALLLRYSTRLLLFC